MDKDFTIMAISGYCDHPLSSCEKVSYDSALKTLTNWKPVGKLNVARTKFQAVVVPKSLNRPTDQVWILGGKNQFSQRIDSIEIYDSRAETW